MIFKIEVLVFMWGSMPPPSTRMAWMLILYIGSFLPFTLLISLTSMLLNLGLHMERIQLKVLGRNWGRKREEKLIVK